MSTQYKSLNHVPYRFGRLRGARLNLQQVNEIIADAHASSEGPHDFAACLGQARARFEASHSLVNGTWVEE